MAIPLELRLKIFQLTQEHKRLQKLDALHQVSELASRVDSLETEVKKLTAQNDEE